MPILGGRAHYPITRALWVAAELGLYGIKAARKRAAAGRTACHSVDGRRPASTLDVARHT